MCAMVMEPIAEYLVRHLRSAGPRRFAAIARDAGVAPSLLPKLLYGSRTNPRLQTIQPLLDYFAAIDRGERHLPLPEIDPRYLPASEVSMESRP
jgi:predicted transcriptional regulator